MSMRALLYFRKSKSRGFVLVSVLMLGMLLISCATAFTWFVRAQVRSFDRERDNLTSRTMAYVLTQSIMKALVFIGANVYHDSLTQKWYQPFLLSMTDDLGVWVLHITPLDDKIPIKSIFLPDGSTVRKEYESVWEDMWTELGHRELAQKTLDFMDKNTRPRVGGVEREYYINRVPYDLSELLIMSDDIDSDILYGFKDGIREKFGLADYCTVFADDRVNINVAPIQVLELLPGLDTGDLADKVIEIREKKGFNGLASLREIPGAPAKIVNQLVNLVKFRSRYFQLRIERLDLEGEGGTSFRIIINRDAKQIAKWEES